MRIVDYTKIYPGFSLFDEENFVQQMNQTAHPMLEKYRKKGDIFVANGISIHYETYLLPGEKSRATIVMFHGFTGFTGKFYEVIYYFLKQNYSVVVFDFRGHGLSTRELEDGFWAKTYVKDFNSYVTDTEELIKKVVLPIGNGKPLLVYAHSMGGNVASQILERNPDWFDGAVLSCPMFGVKTAGIPEWLVKFICRINILKNGGTDFIAGSKDFNTGEFTRKPCDEESYERYHYYDTLRKTDVRYHSKCATYKWMLEAMKAAKVPLKKESIVAIKTPILLFQSEKDEAVKNERINLFEKRCKRAGKVLMEKVFMKGALHEIFSSQNRFLNGYYYEIFSFYDKIVSGSDKS